MRIARTGELLVVDALRGVDVVVHEREQALLKLLAAIGQLEVHRLRGELTGLQFDYAAARTWSSRIATLSSPVRGAGSAGHWRAGSLRKAPERWLSSISTWSAPRPLPRSSAGLRSKRTSAKRPRFGS